MKWSHGSVCSKVQMICIWSSLCHCHPIISFFIKIQIGLTFLVLAYPGCHGKRGCHITQQFHQPCNSAMLENATLHTYAIRQYNNVGDHALGVAVARVWNSLPSDVTITVRLQAMAEDFTLQPFTGRLT